MKSDPVPWGLAVFVLCGALSGALWGAANGYHAIHRAAYDAGYSDGERDGLRQQLEGFPMRVLHDNPTQLTLYANDGPQGPITMICGMSGGQKMTETIGRWSDILTNNRRIFAVCAPNKLTWLEVGNPLGNE